MDSETPTRMSRRVKITLAAYMAALNTFVIGGLVVVLPGNVALPLAPDTRLLIAAALAGALGSCIHLATSFVSYAGARDLQQDWALWYAFRPGIGSALALVVYFTLRAGMVSATADSAAAVNPYGVAAVAALSGLFAKQATEKLREVFENFCASRPSTQSE